MFSGTILIRGVSSKICRLKDLAFFVVQISISQPPGRGTVPDPGINYSGPREVLLEFVILVF
jgi:hypothetical protein